MQLPVVVNSMMNTVSQIIPARGGRTLTHFMGTLEYVPQIRSFGVEPSLVKQQLPALSHHH